MLDGMHKGTTSTRARSRRRPSSRKTLHDRLSKLEMDLTEAIKSERYEEAARFRDEINQVKQAVAPEAGALNP